MAVRFFYGAPFSQWFPSKFVVDNIEYNCAEQYMMAQKALMFDDPHYYTRIMAATQPSQQKFFGRLVGNFDKVIWETKCRGIVFDGNLAKFSQDPKLLRYLLDTGDDELVEASPTDTIWGIGIGENDFRRYDRKQWRGTNWFGIELMNVRNALK